MLENNQKELILIEDLGMLYINNSLKEKRKYGLYKCHCGNEFKTKIDSVKSGNTSSCGCYNKQRIKELNYSHGLRQHRLYRIFQDMKNRCFNKNRKAYKYYGARGITICNEWLDYFMNFYNWAIENGYQDDLTIDRIDNDGNYEPSNCRWETKTIQARNRKKIQINNTSGYRGVNQNGRKYQSRICVNRKSISLGYFDNPIDAAKAYDNYILFNNLEHTRNFN